MPDTILKTDHQRSEAWTQIWFSKNGDYDPLKPEVRNRLEAFLLSVLEQERAAVYGKPLPAGNSVNIPKPEEPVLPVPGLSIHDPALYSFGQKKLWIPWAQDMTSGVRRGRRAKGYPEGAIVHWTAGWRNGLESGSEFQKSSGMSYFLIDKDGNVGQGDPLDYWGYHAGPSSYPGLSGTVADELVGFELQAAGNLRKNGDLFYPWWDEGKNLSKNAIPASEVVYSPKCGNIAAGYYHRYTDAQMLFLRKSLCWLHLNNPAIFQIKYIVGHDEVSPTRKTDPGAALVTSAGAPMTMPEFRDQIADDVRIIMSNR